MKTKTWFIIVSVCLVFIVGTGVFMFFYGKQYGVSGEVTKREELQKTKNLLLDSLVASEKIRKGLEQEKLRLLDSLAKSKVAYEKINVKYNKIYDIVRVMPTTEQVKFLAEWLSKDSGDKE